MVDHVVAEDNLLRIVLYRHGGIQGGNGTTADARLILFEADAAGVTCYQEPASVLQVNSTTGSTGRIALETDVASVVR